MDLGLILLYAAVAVAVISIVAAMWVLLRKAVRDLRTEESGVPTAAAPRLMRAASVVYRTDVAPMARYSGVVLASMRLS
jgi:hypothetical protein